MTNIENLIEAVRRLPCVRSSEIDGEESDGTPRHFRNRAFVSLAQLERLLRSLPGGHDSANKPAGDPPSSKTDDPRFDPVKRARLIAIAKECAATDPERHDYTRSARGDNWMPHEWVLKAMAAVHAAGPGEAQDTHALSDGQISDVIIAEWRRQWEGRGVDTEAWLPMPSLIAELTVYIRAAIATIQRQEVAS